MRCILHSILVLGMAATSIEGGELFDSRIEK
jgi:hypothetical protein